MGEKISAGLSENKTRCLLELDLHNAVGIITIQRNPPQVKRVQNGVENLTSELIKSHFVRKFVYSIRQVQVSPSTQYVHGTVDT